VGGGAADREQCWRRGNGAVDPGGRSLRGQLPGVALGCELRLFALKLLLTTW
jgi:hypothetical protein